MPSAIGEHKECTKCKTVKHIDEFYRDGRTKDGFTYYCKLCKIATVQTAQPTNAMLKRQLELSETLVNWFRARLPDLLDPRTLEVVRRILDEETGLDPKWPRPKPEAIKGVHVVPDVVPFDVNTMFDADGNWIGPQ